MRGVGIGVIPCPRQDKVSFLLVVKSELLQVPLSEFPFTAIAFAFFNRARI